MMKRIILFTLGTFLSLFGALVCFYALHFENISSQLSIQSNRDVFDEKLSQNLYKEVRLLCWILTSAKNHAKKAMHVKKTWGKRCNKLLFMSDEKDAALGTVVLPVTEGYVTLWDKTKGAFHYIYNHHFDEAEWFLKADDDSYMIPENIRYMLYQYRTQTPLYFGHRYSVPHLEEGYMGGGGYILSKASLKKLVTTLIPNKTICVQEENGAEDAEIGRCLQHVALFVDERDSKMEKRFFPVGIRNHLKPKKSDGYDRAQYHDVAQGSLKCCSETPAGFHYITPHEMFMLDYLTMRVHPFGVISNYDKELPRKFTLQEIINASDVDSLSPNYRKHKFYHNLDEYEVE